MSLRDINMMMDELTVNDNTMTFSPDIENITNELNDLSMNNSNCIEERREAGMYGIPNRYCVLVDDEDFIYQTLILPQVIFNELHNSVPFTGEKFNGYEDYFNMFCEYNQDVMISSINVIDVGRIFDTMFDKKMINYNYCYDVINKTLSDLNIFETEHENDEYITDYIRELLYGLRLIINKLSYLIEHYNDLNYSMYGNEMIRLLNNYCVICIYLTFYCETNIFADNDEKIIFS